MQHKYIIIVAIFFLYSLGAKGQTGTLEDIRLEGEGFRAESKYDSAFLTFQKLIFKAEEERNVEFQIRARLGIAAIYIETSKLDLAKGLYKQVITLSDQSDNQSLRYSALHGMGVVYSKAKNYDSALYYYDQVRGFFTSENETLSLATLAANMATIYEETEDLKKAIEKNLVSAKLYHKAEMHRDEANRYYYLGDDHLQLDQVDSAEHYFRMSYSIADSLRFPDTEGWALHGLARVNASHGNYKEAYDYMTQGFDVIRSIFSDDYDDRLLELREKYNTASLELDIERQKAIVAQQRKSKIIILIIGIALVIIVTIWLYVVDQRRKGLEILAEKNEQIAKQQIDDLLQEQEISSLQGVLEGQESERKRVAMDLHDRLGGILSMVKLHFSSFEEKIDNSDPNKQKFLKASELLDQATGEVRSISHDLLSGVLTKFGLVPALEDLKEKITSTGQLKVNLYPAHLNGALNAEHEIQVYRIVQELMSNILKHSKATEANIQLNKNEGHINLIVEDDGVGFDYKNLNGKGGIGLNNLKARVAKLNGSFHIDSGRGAGTTISIDIPTTDD